ncbi:hypothetical protein LCGC14_0650210 [marine sediment metagenome]|uniref:Uncharacterized protein n=1 Tax=marine sediment metagenome TaxID=412755 RepID=A0A0F9RG94_9ZZZZ|nr:hypothetical protein [Candidatus Aminicenantes bacterium]
MTNEQCIAVAEKVWWWEFDKARALHTDGLVLLQRTDVDEQVGLIGLRMDIESWQGFGRTLEAMEARGFDLGINYEPFLCFIKGDISIEIIWGHKMIKLIEATHLAALEAVRKEKEDAEV